MYLNIQGLAQNKTELEWIICQWKPIVICISETHVTEEFHNNEVNIKEYNTIITYSTSKHTGGTIIYVKKEYKYKEILNETIYMNMWLSGIELNIKNCKYDVLNVYHSPSSSDANFLGRLEEILEEYSTKTDILILVGDFNINIAKNTYYSNRLNNIIRNNGLYQKVDKFTRITKESATIIDLMITNEKEIPFQIHLTPKITDHCILTVYLKNDNNQESFTKKFRNFKQFNEINFQLDLMKTEWLSDCTNTNYLAEHLAKSLITVLDKHAPIEQKIVKSSWANTMWWTPTIGQEIAERDKMYRRAVITQQDIDWQNYKIKRNSVVQLIRRQKEVFYQEKIDEVKDNPVEMWKTLKQLVKSNKKDNKKEDITFNNELEKNEETIANKFNIYFLKSIEELVTNANQNQMDEILSKMIKCDVKLDKFKQLEFCELKKIVKEMKKKNSSVDGITTNILQYAFEVIGERFLQLINTSLENGCFPSTWKTSTIIPLEKKINTIKCEEHRPINMVPTYEKLMEIIVNDQIIKYIEDNKLLTKYQAGFRKKIHVRVHYKLC